MSLLTGKVGILGVAVIILISCDSETTIRQFELADADETGIDFFNNVAHLPDQNIIEYMYHYNGGGVAVGDINNDGLEDIYLSANQGPDQLYLNTGGLHFKNISRTSGIVNTEGWSTGVTMADINQDGWMDIYVCQVGGYKTYEGKNKLFINNQNGTFSEGAEEYGLGLTGFFTQAAFFDYDQDGDNDLFLLNHAVHTPRSYQASDRPLPRDLKSGDYLFRNDTDGTSLKFTDVTEFAGIKSHARGYGLGLVVSDVNNDNWMDIYVGNDFHENDYLYINQKDGTFKDELVEMIPHTTQFTMGLDIQDINRDGEMDIFSVDMMPKERAIRMKSGGEDPYKLKEAKFSFGYHAQVARNNFQINKGGETFADISAMTNMFATDWSWSVLIEDYDNNGKSDVFISNGIFKRPNDLDYINFLSNYNLSLYSESVQDSIEKILIDQMPTLKIPNAMYAQLDAWEFEDVSEKWNLDHKGYSGATAIADFDLDGDLDLIVNNLNQPAWLLKNNSDTLSNYHFLQLHIVRGDHKSVSGTTVSVYSAQQQWTKQISTVRGFQASSSSIMSFGLGDITMIDSLVLEYHGSESKLYDIDVDQMHEIDLNSLVFQPTKKTTKTSNIKVEQTEVSIARSNLNDFNIEPLVPFRLSLQRQPVTLADFDGDGVMELFVGGASGYEAKLYQLEKGQYKRVSSIAPFQIDGVYDDVACAVADFDGDGHLDIYVASGGNGHEEGSYLLEDRLYMGDGNLGFKRKKGTLPRTNASKVLTADIDLDGDMDLFVGTLNIPGAYGFPPASLVLENREEANLQVSQVIEAGMISDASWYYEPVDEYPRLATVGEWEPLRLWKVDEGNLKLIETPKNLNNIKGWFRSLEAKDLNQDGKMDFLLGNIGQNIIMHTSDDQPVRLYLDDFDGNGQSDPIISYFLDGKEIPYANKDMLVAQIPFLKKEFNSYNKFAAIKNIPQMLGDMYDEEKCIVKEANEFRHLSVLSFDSGYSIQPLPTELQISPINDFWVGNLNSDNLPDLITGGNLMDQFSMLGQQDANALSICFGKKSEPSLFEHKEFVDVGFIQVNQIIKDQKGGWIFVPYNGNLWNGQLLSE